LLERQRATFNRLCEFDPLLSQAIPLPKSSGDQNISHPKAGVDINIPQYQGTTTEIAFTFREAIMFQMTAWKTISNEKPLMVDIA